jgi:hypothetical protein
MVMRLAHACSDGQKFAAEHGKFPPAPLRNERFLDDGKAAVSEDDAIHNVELVSRHDEKPRWMVANARVFVP